MDANDGQRSGSQAPAPDIMNLSAVLDTEQGNERKRRASSSLEDTPSVTRIRRASPGPHSTEEILDRVASAIGPSSSSNESPALVPGQRQTMIEIPVGATEEEMLAAIDEALAAAEDDEEEEEDSDDEVFESAAEIPRVGGWIVRRPPPDAEIPPLEVPNGAPEDPDDRPILGESSSSFFDRPWIEELKAEQSRKRAHPEQEEAEKDAARLLRRAASPMPRQATPSPPSCPLSLPLLAEKSEGQARQAIVAGMSGEVPAFLKEDLITFIEQARIPLARNARRGTDRPAFAHLEERPFWLFPLDLKRFDTHNFIPMLFCHTQTFSYDVVAVPTILSKQLQDGQPVNAWYDGKGKKRLEDGTYEPDAFVTPPMPETEAILALQASTAEATEEAADLRSENATLKEQLSDVKARMHSLQENAKLSRQLYNQASDTARSALAESSAATEKMEKLERQLSQGLAAAEERWKVSSGHWTEERRQLEDQIRLLRGSDERAQSAETRRQVNEWRAWKASDAERRKREAKLEKERLQRQRELEEEREELLALQEEEEQAHQDSIAASMPAQVADAGTSNGQQSEDVGQMGPFAGPAGRVLDLEGDEAFEEVDEPTSAEGASALLFTLFADPAQAASALRNLDTRHYLQMCRLLKMAKSAAISSAAAAASARTHVHDSAPGPDGATDGPGESDANFLLRPIHREDINGTSPDIDLSAPPSVLPSAATLSPSGHPRLTDADLTVEEREELERDARNMELVRQRDMERTERDTWEALEFGLAPSANDADLGAAEADPVAESGLEWSSLLAPLDGTEAARSNVPLTNGDAAGLEFVQEDDDDVA